LISPDVSQRLLEANERSVATAAHATDRVRLLQDRAVLLARLGRVAEAETTLADAEQQLPDDAPPVLRLRFEYVRAIDTYFSMRFSDAQRRMLAALGEARRSNEPVLIAECESALALFMQREGDVRAAASHARSVLANPSATLEARYRVSLALASLYQDAHDHEAAYRLYQQTHEMVRELGDEIAMASSLQRAALSKAAYARQSAGCGELNARSVREAIDALQQCIQYASEVPDGPPTTLDQLLLAEMYVLQKRYQSALDIYDSWLPRCEGDGFLHECTVAIADRAYCLLQLGRTDEGYAQAVVALRRLDEAAPAEIRAIVHDNMATALDAVKQPAQARQHRTLAHAAWEAHCHEQREARRVLNENTATTLH
jgi:tetratricopeptide (TPR) repeat protein